MFCKKVALKHFVKFTGKHLYWSLFFNKVSGLDRAFLQKKGMILPTTQQNLLFPQSSYSKHCHRTFFTKNYEIFVIQIVPELCPVLQCPRDF